MPSESSPSCGTVLPRDRIAQDVKQIVAEFSNVAADEIRENQNVFDDLGWDSLDIVECTMEIEEHFGISVPDELADRVQTVGQIVAGVVTLLAELRPE